MFSTPMCQFLASNSSLLRWHAYSAKKIGLKRSFLPEIGAWTFYYPLYGVATAYSTNENPSTDKLSRAINYPPTPPPPWTMLKNWVFGTGGLPLFVFLIKTHIHEPKINDILSKLIESKPEQKKNIFLNSFFFFAQFCFQLVLTKCHKSWVHEYK